jgi:hypothetical protein
LLGTTILLTAASGLSAPSIISILDPDDYPTWAVAKGVSAASYIRWVVDPQGKTVQCTILSEIGDPQLAKSVCRILSRKHSRSPTLREGQKVHAFLDTMIAFYLPDTEDGRKIGALRQSPDAELTVNQVPNNKPADVSVILAFDQSGRVTDCAPSEGEKLVALANVACGQRALFDHAIQKDMSGQPVAYVTRKRVRFTISSPVQ